MYEEFEALKELCPGFWQPHKATAFTWRKFEIPLVIKQIFSRKFLKFQVLLHKDKVYTLKYKMQNIEFLNTMRNSQLCVLIYCI